MSTPETTPIATSAATTESALDKLLNTPLKATGIDIPDGNYPGTLFAFGEPFKMDQTKSKFYKEGDPKVRDVFEMHFGVSAKGALTPVSLLVNVPAGGASNKKSGFYKALKNLKPDAFDKEGNFKEGSTLAKFIGSSATLQITKNAKDFPRIEGISSMIEGLTYPTLEACEPLKAIVAEMRSDADDSSF